MDVFEIKIEDAAGIHAQDHLCKHVSCVQGNGLALGVEPVNSGDRTIGLLVDAVSDILTVSRQDIQSVPDMMRESQNDYVEGIAVLDGRMVTLLGMTKLTSSFGGGLDGLVEHAA